MSGFTKEEAERMRAQGRQIVACWWCLYTGKDNHQGERKGDLACERPYWPWEQTTVVGAMIACPAHFNSEGFGLTEIGKLEPI